MLNCYYGTVKGAKVLDIIHAGASARDKRMND